MNTGLNKKFEYEAMGGAFIRASRFLSGFFLALSIAGCSEPVDSQEITPPDTIAIPAGPFMTGSDAEEREYGYTLDEAAYGHTVTRDRGWYNSERDRQMVPLDAYGITTNLITNRQYAAFIADTGHPAPDVDPETWAGYRLIHPYERTRRHAWEGGSIPEGRADHPVVLVSYADARSYAEWLSAQTGEPWRLPTELEWEKAARGEEGLIFPWGNEYDETLLNSHDAGPFDTLPVGSFPGGASPFGLKDPAGQVFEWTSTSPRPGRYYVKGGSWDDRGCGICRPAAHHTRPENLKHILVGFRLVRTLETGE